MHVFWTSVGLALGYRGHIFEESAEERYAELIKKHKNVPWYPKAQLLAERYAREKAEKEGKGFNRVYLTPFFDHQSLHLFWTKAAPLLEKISTNL